MEPDIGELKRWHAVLHAQYEEMCALVFHGCPEGLSTDTAAALGFAVGSLSKAKALLGRDIDDLKARGFGKGE
jgi:hypothetical protein